MNPLPQPHSADSDGEWYVCRVIMLKFWSCVYPHWFKDWWNVSFFLLDINNGVSSNWRDALRQHLQQTSLPCLQSVISSLVSLFLLLLALQQEVLAFRLHWCRGQSSSFTQSISLDHFHVNRSNQPVLHEVFTCCLKASTADFTCKSFRCV